MVLTFRKRTIFLFAIFFLNTLFAFTINTPSSLLQYGENIDWERLHLLENRQIIRFIGGFSFSVDDTYVIHNTGAVHQITLGVLLHGWMNHLSPAAVEMRFFVDGIQVQYIVREHFNEFIMGETRLESLGSSYTWALIDVLFPAHGTVTIQVQYRMRFNATLARTWLQYNTLFRTRTNPFFANMDYWRGPTRFILYINNDTIAHDNIEGHWIYNIQFYHREDKRRDISTMEYLLELQRLQTDLMNIQRISGTLTRIEFSETFMQNYRRSFTIGLRDWEGEWIPYVGWSYPDREIGLRFFEGIRGNISRRELSPYELIFLTNNQLRVMRNIFFARHGFIFQSLDLQNIFAKLNFSPDVRFHVPNPNFHEGLLTDIDRANIAIIQRLEALAGD